jgi:S-DNA-T family DNA segregation ATPase FtsK/SpoIIIE
MPPPTSASVPARAEAGEEPVLLELAGVGLALTGLLLGSAIVTLAPEGSLRPLANVTGALGRRVAEALTLALGLGAYVVAAFPVAWGISCLKGRAPAAFGRKAALAPLVAVTTAVLAALLIRKLPVPGLFRSGPGGYLGVAFGQALFHGLGRAASLLALGLLTASVLLTTDFRVSAFLARVLPGRRRAEADAGGTAVLDDEPAGDAPAADDDSEGGLVPVGELDAEDDTADSKDDADDDVTDRDDVPTASADASPAGDDAAGTAVPAFPPRPRRPRAPRPAPKRRRGAYEFPPTALLEPGEPVDPDRVRGEIDRNGAVLGATLRSFGIEARVVEQRRGPAITFYELELGAGTRINRITQLDKDLAVALKAENVRVVAPIPGKNTVGVEVPNTIREPVRLLDILEEGQERGQRKAIPLFLGKDAMGEPIVEDLAGMPHMLIAGATGSGKSVCVNSILLSVLLTRTPDEVKFILMDPKQVELSFFEGIPHLLTPVVTNMKKASQILEWAVAKMEQRYDLLLRCGVRNISGYNAQGAERIAAKRAEFGLDAVDAPDLMPYLVIVVDELADLMLQHGKDVETAIIRLAAKSRAVGIHLILATQRPSVDVITGLIKSNMPMRMSFKVSSMIDSRVILDHKGAEKLLGRGDTLFIPPGTSNPKRAQGTYISDAEVKSVVDFVKEKAGPAEYMDLLGETESGLPDPMKEDELYDEAVTAVLTTKLGSASMLQRKFGIGYTRASRLIDMMCDHKVVGPHKGSKAREILVTLEEWGARRAEEMAGSAPGAADFSSPPDPDAGAPMGSSDEADGIGDKGASKDASGVPSAWD